MLKILMLETGGWGGILHYSFNLLGALQKAGINAALATNEKYELENLSADFRVIKIFKREAYLKTLCKLIRLIRREGITLVHVQSVISPRKDWLLFLVLALLRVRVIITAHNVLPHATRLLEPWSYRIMYRLARGIILHSFNNLEEFRKKFPSVASGKIRVIPHGHYAFFSRGGPSKRRSRERLYLPPDKKIILFFGAIREYKGLDILMESACAIVQSRKDILFLAVGTDLEGKKDQYQGLHRDLNLGKDFRLIFEYIPFEEVSDYFYASDLVVLPYRKIYQSGVLLLAMASGIPVIASRVGSFPETIQDGISGILVPPGDVPSLREGILSIIDNPERLEKMGRMGKQIAEVQFSWQAIAEQTRDFYREVAGTDG